MRNFVALLCAKAAIRIFIRLNFAFSGLKTMFRLELSNRWSDWLENRYEHRSIYQLSVRPSRQTFREFMRRLLCVFTDFCAKLNKIFALSPTRTTRWAYILYKESFTPVAFHPLVFTLATYVNYAIGHPGQPV